MIINLKDFQNNQPMDLCLFCQKKGMSDKARSQFYAKYIMWDESCHDDIKLKNMTYHEWEKRLKHYRSLKDGRYLPQTLT